MFKKLLDLILNHKIRSLIVLLLVVIGGWLVYKNFFNKTLTETRYVLTQVEKNTLINSVEGTGQVSASNQVDIQPKASGDITAVYVKAGQTIKTGTVIAQINAKEALKTVRDAQANLASAQLSLEKLQQPADALTILQAENTLTKAQESKSSAQDDLIKAYEDGYNDVADTFLDLPTIMIGLEDIVYGFDYSKTQSNLDYYSDSVKSYNNKIQQYRDDADNKYQVARKAYDKNFIDYKNTSRYDATSTIENLIGETYETSKYIAEAVKSVNNLVQLYSDEMTEHDLTPDTIASEHLSDLNEYTGKTNTYLSTLLSANRTIQTDRETIINAERTIEEKTLTLADLKAGTDALDLKSQQLSIQQKQNSLRDAQETLANYTVKAPFDGIVTEINVAKGDTVSSGTVVATLITEQKVAEISLNEVDAAKVKAGQKVTLTFDAIEDLEMTGTVGEIDALGTVSQGVVSYGVKIIFDVQDERIKPGMSVSAVIIVESKIDVLTVTSSLIKTAQDGTYYVEIPGVSTTEEEIVAAGNTGILLANGPDRQIVEIGIANDTLTEITSGLSEGDWVISRTISGEVKNSTKTTQTSGSSILQGGSRAATRSMMGGGPPGM